MSDAKDELEELREWFRFWGDCVAAVDFESAKPLFAERVVGFGTYVEFVHGLDALHGEQWSKVWPKITDFRFNVEHLVGEIHGDAAWAAVPWSSTGPPLRLEGLCPALHRAQVDLTSPNN